MNCILPNDHYTEFNGIKIRWFIGDINTSKAKELGLNPRWTGELGSTKLIDSGPYWEAWGSCLGKAYQLFAWFDTETRELIDIHPLANNGSPYFKQENFDLLTKI